MLITLKDSSKLKIFIFIILELNFIYAIGYIGHMLIGGDYTFLVNLSTFISLGYILALLVIGYIIHRFLSKRIGYITARVFLDDSVSISLLLEEKIKKIKDNSSSNIKIEELKNEFYKTMKIMEEYDSILVMRLFGWVL